MRAPYRGSDLAYRTKSEIERLRRDHDLVGARLAGGLIPSDELESAHKSQEQLTYQAAVLELCAEIAEILDDALSN